MYRRRSVNWKIIAAILSIGLCIFLIVGCTNQTIGGSNQVGNQSSGQYKTYTEKLYDTDWDITYDIGYKRVQKIKGSFIEYDKSSKYWEEYTRKHGDNSLWLHHKKEIIGKPLGDNWYLLEI